MQVIGRRDRWSIYVGAALGLGLLAIGCCAPAYARAAPADATPQLSIAVNDGGSSAAVGDTLAYTITVRNLGVAPVAGLTITQSLPAGMHFASADPAGTATSAGRTWRIALDATGTAVMHTTMPVLKTPDQLLRLATVACATAAHTTRPIVCASHSDQLPAGAAQAAKVAKEAKASAQVTKPAAPVGFGWWIGLAGTVLLVAGTALVLIRRRKAHAAT